MPTHFDRTLRTLAFGAVSAFVLGCSALLSDDHSSVSGTCPCAANATPVIEIPIDFDSAHGIIEARIKGLDRPVRLVLDTGSSTMIRADLADKIAFAPDPSVSERSVSDIQGGVVEFESILLDRLTVGTAVFDELPASFVESPIWNYICPIDGLLGTGGLSVERGFLDRIAVEVSRDQQQIRLSEDARLLDRGASTVVLTRYVSGDRGEKYDQWGSMVALAIDGHRARAVLDTGMQGLSEMSLRTFQQIGRSIDDDRVRAYLGTSGVALGGVTPAERIWVTTIDMIELGDLLLPDVPFRVVESNLSGRPELLLGQNLLQRLNMTLDYRRNELRVDSREPDSGLVGFPVQLDWNVEAGRVIVSGILEGGAAQQAGIQLGDELVRSGDVSVDASDPESRCASSMAARAQYADGEKRRYRLRREGHEFDVTVPVEEPWSAFVQHAEAQHNLGWMYLVGHGVATDDVEAAKWFRTAAVKGQSSAQYNLGRMYSQGRGVVKNDAEAVVWYRRAAEQGDASAQTDLGKMYIHGNGVAKNDAEAVRWLRMAADQGNSMAQSNLGLMYQKGRGVAQDDAEAAKWFRMAEEGGN